MRPPAVVEHRFKLAASAASTFELLADPHRLDQVTPSWFRLRPLVSEPLELSAGARIAYRLRWRGLPLPWTSLITDWVEERYFAYEQLRGPFRCFRHEHFFEEHAGRTEVLDRVEFRSPGGAFIDRLLAARDLRRIFEHRERKAREMLAAPQPPSVARRGASRIPLTSATSSPIDRPR